jgi:DNA repair exonuclease SbcCD ATPase subunit
MKRNVLFLLAGICLVVSMPAASQKYKSASDTVKLNEEWVKVSNAIAELTAELTVTQNNLPGYVSKAAKSKTEAQVTAQQSSDQAHKATNGDLGDAKNAKKKAKKALNDAEDASEANENTEKQEKKIDKLTEKLQKKQKTLQELEEMRAAIRLMHQ